MRRTGAFLTLLLALLLSLTANGQNASKATPPAVPSYRISFERREAVIGWATAWDYIQPNPEIVAYLLAHGARQNIFSAVAMGEKEVIRELVARRTPNDIERRMNGARMRRMPLHLAVIKNQPASVTTLLDLGANTESLDEADFSALDLAALDGRHDLAQVLLERGGKVRLPAAQWLCIEPRTSKDCCVEIPVH